MVLVYRIAMDVLNFNQDKTMPGIVSAWYPLTSIGHKRVKKLT